MDRTANAIFQKLYEVGDQVYKLIKEKAIAPNTKKHLKYWSISDAAKMVGKSSQTLRNLEETGKIAKATIINKGSRPERLYDLKLINALRDYFKTRPHKPKNTAPAVLGFANFKGGAAKTTSAILSAQYFAKEGYRVLFIDCDSQGSATQMFGFVPDEDFGSDETSLNVLIGEDSDIKKVIRKTYWDGLDLVPANLSLYNAELMVPTQISKHNVETGENLAFYSRLKDSLEMIKEDYDIVIIDCPPSMGMISINAIFAANALIIEMPPVIVDFASTIQFFKMVSEVMERLPKKSYAFIRVLITKYNGRTTAKSLTDLMKHFYGQYIMSNNMIESEAISKAAANMQTIYEYDKFIGDKKTFDRAIQNADQINEELKELIILMWNKSKELGLTEDLEKEVINA